MSASAPLRQDTSVLELLVLAPLSLEAKAVRAGAPWARVERVGMGPRRASRRRAQGRR